MSRHKFTADDNSEICHRRGAAANANSKVSWLACHPFLGLQAEAKLALREQALPMSHDKDISWRRILGTVANTVERKLASPSFRQVG